jgi:hypothetical protein
MRSLGFLLLFPLVFSSPDLFSGEKPSRNSSPANYLQVREKLRHIEIRLEGLQQKLDSSKQQGVDLTNQPEPRGTKPIPAPPALSIDPNTTLRQVEDRLERLQQRLDSSKQQGGDLTNQPESSGTKPITPSRPLSIDSNSTHGNEGWNLLVLRELALKNSPDILIKKAQLRVDKKGIPVLEFGYMPTVKANVSVNDYTRISQFETYSEPQPYSTFSYGIESRWV